MATTELPREGRTLRVWNVVERLVVNRYDELRDETMRGSFYLIREWLSSELDDGEITPEEYDYFTQEYDYYLDKWSKYWEPDYGLERPRTKPPTVVIEDEN